MKIPQILLNAIASIVNSYVNLDADSAAQLRLIDGKILQVNITTLSQTVFVVFQDQQMLIKSTCEERPNAVITAELTELMQMAINKKELDAADAAESSINISGDNEFAQLVQSIFANLDIDWEEQLAKVIGDIPASHIGDFVSATNTKAKEITESIRSDIREFLQYEIEQVPDLFSVEQFIQKVDETNLDVERAEARINKIIMNLKKSEHKH